MNVVKATLINDVTQEHKGLGKKGQISVTSFMNDPSPYLIVIGVREHGPNILSVRTIKANYNTYAHKVGIRIPEEA